MNPIVAAGLFDNPWVVAVILVGGALINWLSQRRQAKQREQESEHAPGEESPTAPQKVPGEFNMEETLRRLLGEEMPPPSPAPPPVPRSAPSQRPPPPTIRRGVPAAPSVRKRREDSGEATGPGHLPPRIAVARAADASREADRAAEQAAARFEQLNEQGRHPAVAQRLRRHSRSGAWGALWRDRPSVRRAFVGSLVFGPPKGLEP